MKNENFYELLLNQQNGKIVKISIIYPQPKKWFESTDNGSMFDNLNQRESNSRNNQNDMSFSSRDSGDSMTGKLLE